MKIAMIGAGSVVFASRLATELDLLSFPGELGGGLAVWHPRGAIVRKIMEDYSRARHEGPKKGGGLGGFGPFGDPTS